MSSRLGLVAFCIAVSVTVCLSEERPVSLPVADLVGAIARAELDALTSKIAALPTDAAIADELDALIRESEDETLVPILLVIRGDRFERDEQFVELASQCLRRSGEDAPIAARELARAGDSGRSELLRLLSTGDSWIRCAILRALAAAGSTDLPAPEAVERAASGGRAAVAAAALAAMPSFAHWSADFESKIPEIASKRPWPVRLAVVEHVLPRWERRDAALALALEALEDPEPIVRCQALKAIARLERPDRAAAAITAGVGDLLAKSEPNLAVSVGGTALSQCGPAGLRALFTLAAKDEFRSYSRKLRVAAANTADATWLTECAAAFRGPSSEARHLAIVAVKQVLTTSADDLPTARAIVVAALADDSASVRLDAVGAASVCRSWDQELTAALTPLLADPSRDVRVAAARAIRIHGDRGVLSSKHAKEAAASGEGAVRLALLAMPGAPAETIRESTSLAEELVAGDDVLDRWVAAEAVLALPVEPQVRRRILRTALVRADRRTFDAMSAAIAVNDVVVDQDCDMLAEAVASCAIASPDRLVDVLVDRGDPGVAALARAFKESRNEISKVKICLTMSAARSDPASVSLLRFALGVCHHGDSSVRSIGRTLVWSHSVNSFQPMRN